MRWLVVVFVIITILAAVLTSSSTADFTVSKESPGGVLKAVTLDFTSHDTADNKSVAGLFESVVLNPGGFAVRTVRLLNEGSNTAPLTIRYEPLGNSEELCAELDLKILENWKETYLGKLNALNLNADIEKEKKDLVLVLSLDSAGSENAAENFCRFDIVFTSRPSPKGGLFAERRLSNSVSSKRNPRP